MLENFDLCVLKIFCLFDDENVENYIDKYNDRIVKDFVFYIVDENGNLIFNKDNFGEIKIDVICCWNGYFVGLCGGWLLILVYN